MSDQLTFDELRAYQAGQLSGPARHRVERVLLEDPFYADALAGLEAMQQATRPTPEQLASLRDALQDRIHTSATKKRLWHLWIATITAALLFVFAVAIYLIYFLPKKTGKPMPSGPKTGFYIPAPAALFQPMMADARVGNNRGQGIYAAESGRMKVTFLIG